MNFRKGDPGLKFLGRNASQTDAGERVLKIGRPAADKTHAEWEKTEATRYLCAAAYLHRTFRDSVVTLFAEEQPKAIAVSYGVDAATVLKHCLAARRLSTVCDLLLALPPLLVLVAFLALSSFPGVAVGLSVLAFLGAWAIAGWERWKTEFEIVRQRFSRNNFTPDSTPSDFNPAMRQTLHEVEVAQTSNVMIYSGFSPFVGSGINIGGWSFALDLDKGKEEMGRFLQPQPFQVRELYEKISNDVRVLNLEGLVIDDKVCINGQDIRGDAAFLTDDLARPCTKIDAASVQAFVENPSSKARHYKLLRLVDWSGELVLSAFLRFSKPGHSLFVEANYCLLVPLKEKYHKIDSMNPIPTWQDWLRLVLASGVKAGFIWLVWPLYILWVAFRPVTAWSRREEMKHCARQNPMFDYGAATSLRERESSSLYQRYFQKLDKEMYVKILEGQILNSIIGFLDAKDIDVSDLKETQTRIINSGIIISGGGSVEANTLAVGSRSTAVGSESAPKSGIRIIERFAGGSKHAS